MSEIEGIVEIDQPNNNIYKVDGTLIVKDNKYNFDVNQILLRVSTLYKWRHYFREELLKMSITFTES